MRSAERLRLSDQFRHNDVTPPDPVKSGPPGLVEGDTSADGRVGIADRLRQDGPVRSPSRRSSGVESDRPVSKSSAVGKRLLRTIFGFALAILIGVAGTLSWQAYGDKARDTVRAWVPPLDGLVAPVTTKSATANAGSPEVAEQLKPIALDLAVVRKAVEQLAANQQQLAVKEGEITLSIAALQATEKELGDKISSLAATKIAHVPPRRAPQQPLQLNAQ